MLMLQEKLFLQHNPSSSTHTFYSDYCNYAVKEKGRSKVRVTERHEWRKGREENDDSLQWRHLPSEPDLSLEPMISYSVSTSTFQEHQKRRSKWRKGWKSAKLRGRRRGRTRPGGDATSPTETCRPVTCHTRVMDGPRSLAISTLCLRPGKWLKGASKTLRHWEESLAEKLAIICYNFRRQIWQDGITPPVLSQSFTNAVKCRYKSSAQIYLIFGVWGATTSLDMEGFIGS